MGHALAECGEFLTGLLSQRGEFPTGLIAECGEFLTGLVAECEEFPACLGRGPLAAQNQARQADRDANDCGDNCICFNRHGLVTVYAAFRSSNRQIAISEH